jgi:hypothetical protein
MPGGQSQVIAFAAPAAGAPAPVAAVQTTAASTSADALQEGN